MTEILIQHTDVVCPPNPAAVCRHCDDALSEHRGHPIDDTAFFCVEPGRAEDGTVCASYFELADGESLDCHDVGTDPVCDTELCSEHSTEFTTCVATSSVLHHWDCRHHCPDCADASRAGERS